MSTTSESVFGTDAIAGAPITPVTPNGISPNNPPWGIFAAVLTWLTSIALLFVVPYVCVLPYLASQYRGTGATKEILVSDKTFIFLFVLGTLPAHLLTLALIWAIATRFGKLSIKEVFGWTWNPAVVALSALLAIILFIVTMFLVAVLGGQKTDLDRIIESSRPTAILLAIFAIATAPLVEEMVYRGLLYSAFQRVAGQWWAVIIVASMFAGLHWLQYWPNAGAILSITLLSVVLTVVRARTGSLLPCFVVHFVFNGIQSVIILLEPYIRRAIELWRPHPVNGVIKALRLFY